MTNIEVLAQSVGGIAPTVAAAALVPLVFSAAQNGAWLSVVIAMAAMLCIGACITTIARQHSSAGGLYSLVPLGLGREAGLVTGLVTLLAQIVAGPFLLIGTALYVGEFLSAVHIATLHSAAYFLVEVVVLLAVATLALRRVSLSTNLMLIFEACSVTLIVVLLIVVLATQHGSIVDTSQLKLEGSNAHGVILAVVFMILAFGGFESSASLGFEARDPKRAIPVALLGSVFVAGIFYAFNTYVQVLGFSGSNLDLAEQGAPLSVLAQQSGVTWLGDVVLVGVVISFIAATIAWLGYAARVVLTMAEDGVLPGALRRTKADTGSPVGAVFAVALAWFILILYVFVVNGDLVHTFGYFSSLLGYSYSLYYLLVAAAAPVWAYKFDVLTKRVAFYGLGGVIAMLAVFYYSFNPLPPYPTSAFVIAFGGFVLLFTLAAAALRVFRPQFLSGIGLTMADESPSGPAGEPTDIGPGAKASTS